MNFGVNHGTSRAAPVAQSNPLLARAGASSVAGLGDSITNNALASGTIKLTTGPVNFGPLAWQQHAQLASGGRHLISGIYAEAGITTAVVRSQYLPRLLQECERPDAIRPGYCVVLAGVNDASGSVPLAITRDNLIAIWTQLLDAGIEPILCTLTPRGSITSGHDQISKFVRHYAWANKLKLLDFAVEPTLCDNNSGNWLSGLSGDNLHPNATGAKAMGAYVATKYSEWGINQWSPPFASRNADAQNLYSATNALLTTTTGSAPTVTPVGWTLAGSAATSSVAQISNGLGSEVTVTRAGTNCTLTSGGATIPAGSWVVFSARVSATIAGGGQILFAPQNGSFTYAFATTVDVSGVMSALIWVPSARTQPFQVSITTGDSVGKLSQPTAYSLTSLGALG